MASFVSGGNTISKSYIEKELSKQITDSSPYNFRRTADGEVIGDNLVSYDTIVGGSFVWNQLAPLDASEYVGTTSNVSFTMTDGVFTFKSLTDSSVYKNRRYECLTPGHKYFVTAKIYNPSAKTGSIGFRINDGMVNNTAVISIPSEMTEYETFSAIGVPGENQTCIAIASQASLPKDAYFNVKDFMVIDLTLGLGSYVGDSTTNLSLVADYVYSLETATAGAGVAWFKKYFPKEYFEYCEPHFEHVQVSAKNTVGFNQINPSGYVMINSNWYNIAEGSTIGVGTISATVTGENPIRITFNNGWKAIGFLSEPLISGQTYYYNFDIPYNNKGRIQLYLVDDNMKILYRGWTSSVATSRTGTYEISPERAGKRWLVCFGCGDTATSLEISNLTWNVTGDRDGEYEPYKKRTYPLDSSLTLRGIPKLDSANRLYFDGDVYASDGTVTRRYGIIDLGEASWNYYLSGSHNTFNTALPLAKYDNLNGIMNADYTYSTTHTNSSVPDFGWALYKSSAGNVRLILRNDAYTDATEFKATLAGKFLVYELATPTTETAEPFQSPMVVDPLGTEEFVDYGVEQGTRDVSIPVGHETIYEYGVYGKIGEVYDSPTFYGTPTAPTAESGTNTNQIATTAFVQDAVGDFMQKGVDYVTAGQASDTTLGTKATAEGIDTTASGNYSHAEGRQASATGVGSHAEGYDTTASNNYSHAEGYDTVASGRYSHVEGRSTEANSMSQHVFGEYNISDIGSASARGTYVEIVGNGTSDAFSNARTLDWSGNEVLAGKLTVGAAPTADMDVATKKYVDDSIPTIPAQISKLYTATCPTAAATTAKVATLDDSTGFSLTAGVRVAVTFTYGNTATTPTLNVSSSGVKTIAINSSATAYTTGNGTTYNTWGAYETVIFTYTGTYWVHEPSGYQTYLLAPKASPALTGTPTAPTASAGTNTTQIATTAFVQTENSNKQTKPTITSTTLSASGWSNGSYAGLQTTYPVASYDIEIEPNGDSITAAQLSAWDDAQIVGSATTNTLKSLGTVPTVNIPIIVKVWAK